MLSALVEKETGVVGDPVGIKKKKKQQFLALLLRRESGSESVASVARRAARFAAALKIAFFARAAVFRRWNDREFVIC